MFNYYTDCTTSMDLAFVLDLSGSIDVVYHVITNFTRHMIEGLSVNNENVRVAIITYSTDARIEFNLNQYQVSIIQ